jgi:hypothetical protein
MCFTDRIGRSVDVEVWGDAPHGRSKEYSETRRKKEAYNKNRPGFVGIHFLDCYDEKKLELILSKHVDVPAPFNFKRAHDRLIQTTRWSNTDELLETCRVISSEQPDGLLPTSEWLLKRGRHKNRSGPKYSTLATKITLWLGGFPAARQLLGQYPHTPGNRHPRTKWTEESVLKAIRIWISVHGCSPGRSRSKKAKRLTMAAINRFGSIGNAIMEATDRERL